MYRAKLSGILPGLVLLAALVPNCSAQDPSNPQDKPDDIGFLASSRKMARGFGIYVTLGGTFQNPLTGMNLGNIPQALRTVPSNQYGPLAPGVPVTIPGSSYGVNDPNFTNVAMFNIAPQYSLWRVTVRGGIKLTSGNDLDSDNSQNPYQEINQFGVNERGYGTSLVYYTVHWDKHMPGSVRPFGEVELRVQRFVSLVGGYSSLKKTATITLENGYDQYDTFTPFSTQKIASVEFKESYYGAVKLNILGPFIGFSVGVMPTKIRFSSPYPLTTDFKNLNLQEVFFNMSFCLTHTK